MRVTVVPKPDPPIIGRAVLRNEDGHEVRLATRQQVVTTAEGQFSERRTLPKAPVPMMPPNSAAFDIRDNPVIQLQWVQAGIS